MLIISIFCFVNYVCFYFNNLIYLIVIKNTTIDNEVDFALFYANDLIVSAEIEEQFKEWY